MLSYKYGGEDPPPQLAPNGTDSGPHSVNRHPLSGNLWIRQMTELQRRQMLEMVRELTNSGQHLAAKELYDEVIRDFRNSQAR